MRTTGFRFLFETLIGDSLVWLRAQNTGVARRTTRNHQVVIASNQQVVVGLSPEPGPGPPQSAPEWGRGLGSGSAEDPKLAFLGRYNIYILPWQGFLFTSILVLHV